MDVPQVRDQAAVAHLHESRKNKVSIIIPVLNDALALAVLLEDLQPYRSRGHEVIVVDGGSQDNSVSLAYKYADHVQQSSAGRALQMNAGAEIASFGWLWFLHADSRCGVNQDVAIYSCLADQKRVWGRFDVEFDCEKRIFRMIASAMNIRSCLSGIATGDQGIFVRKSLFELCGKFPSIPLMEDIALSAKLRRQSRPVCVNSKIKASARRWQENGILRTILLMWVLRLLYFIGVSPKVLHEWYYRK